MTRAKTARSRPEAGQRGSKVLLHPHYLAVPGAARLGRMSGKSAAYRALAGEAMLELLRLAGSPRTSQ
jgi:hypothetical protein